MLCYIYILAKIFLRVNLANLKINTLFFYSYPQNFIKNNPHP